MAQRQRFRAHRLLVLLLATGVFLGGGLPALAEAEGSESYPTWSDVEAARVSDGEREALTGRLQRALSVAQTEADTAASHAALAARAAEQAETELQRAIDREAALRLRAEHSRGQLEESSEELARMVSWMYINGTGVASTSQLVTSDDPEEFMSKLSTATQVSSSWNALAERSELELNTIDALQRQAEAARTDRERLADAAVRAAEEARDAEQVAVDAVSAAQERSDTVYAQLASLHGTSVEDERRKQIVRQVAEQPAVTGGGGAVSPTPAVPTPASPTPTSPQPGGDSGAGSPGGSGGSQPGSGGGSAGGGSDPGAGGGTMVVDPAAAQAYARSVLGAYGWGDEQFPCLVSLWHGESGWRADARNPWSGAYGIPQAYPAEKMAAAGPDWRTNARTQIDWGLAYIHGRYGSPCATWAIWQARSPHWY
ncbi:MAG: hypothetical protein WDA07_06035 [Leucobacter sp.]